MNGTIPEHPGSGYGDRDADRAARRPRVRVRTVGAVLASIIGAPLLLLVILAVFAGWETVTWRPGDAGAASGVSSEDLSSDALANSVASLKKEARKLEERRAALTPKGPYIIINTVDNRLYLRKGNQLIRESVCSTGSYMSLEGPEGQKWFFMTPRGRFSVKSKQEDPVWIKPDWAFVEEGEPIPAKNARERYEPGVLGMYALGLGDGYFIHGTLYTRLLGRNVTHGCVRLPDEDLEAVFATARIGTPVFIY